MDRIFFNRAVIERAALISALLIGIVLAVAAWGKFFHPAEDLRSLDRWISGVEVLFLLALFFWRAHWPVWTGASILFAGWFGYALCGYCLELPCSCMGEQLNIPTAFSLTLDLLFFIVSLVLSYLLSTRSQWIYFGFLCALMAALVGYAFAGGIYASVLLDKPVI
jgi:hypothetical protein